MADEPEIPVDVPLLPEPGTEPEASAIVETPEGETEGDEDHSGEEKDLHDDKPRGKGAEARINELTRARREAERERDFYKGLVSPSTQVSPQDGAKEPVEADFENYGDFVKALAKHTVATERSKIATETSGAIRQADWSSKVEAVKSEIADYDKVVGSSEIPIAGHVADALLDSERGPELAYHLAQNPDIAERLNRMSHNKALMEMGRLEVALAAPAAKPRSNAPAPITPVRSGSTVKTNLANADMDAFIAERRKQGARY